LRLLFSGHGALRRRWWPRDLIDKGRYSTGLKGLLNAKAIAPADLFQPAPTGSYYTKRFGCYHLGVYYAYLILSSDLGLESGAQS
jgi:hypothetical protein